MNILLVDDDPKNIENLGSVLSLENYSVSRANGGNNALIELEKVNFDLVITDYLMDDMTGLQLTKEVKKCYPNIEVIVLTGFLCAEVIVSAMKSGAYEFIMKSGRCFDTILLNVKKVEELVKLKKRSCQLVSSKNNLNGKGVILGNHPSIRNVMQKARKAASVKSTILIEGETGTGKESLASFLHFYSDRRDKPFITINCGALPEHLAESELFGHQKGSFTGAVQDKKGKFELADGGTIFLDEIGELKPDLQVKFLRVLQEKEVERVGGSKTIKIDVRVIAATNKVLKKEVENGNFREDLFFRLNVLKMVLPPLRERKSDIPEIATAFLGRICSEMGKNGLSFSETSLDIMKKYSWPGNIRELANVVERGIVFSNGNIVDLADLFGTEKEPVPIKFKTHKEATHAFERNYLMEALALNNYNITKTAEMIKLARTNVYEKMRKFDIDNIKNRD